MKSVSDGQAQVLGQPTCHGIDAVALVVLDPVDARHKLPRKPLRRWAPPYPALRCCTTSSAPWPDSACFMLTMHSLETAMILRASARVLRGPCCVLLREERRAHQQLIPEGALRETVQIHSPEQLLWRVKSLPLCLRAIQFYGRSPSFQIAWLPRMTMCSLCQTRAPCTTDSSASC